VHLDPHTHLQLTRTATDQAVRRSQHRHRAPSLTTRRRRLVGRLGLVRPRLAAIRATDRITPSVAGRRGRAGAGAL